MSIIKQVGSMLDLIKRFCIDVSSKRYQVRDIFAILQQTIRTIFTKNKRGKNIFTKAHSISIR